MAFSADKVWGLAIRADETNGGFYNGKDHARILAPPQRLEFVDKVANVTLVKRWLREGLQPTERETRLGRECRDHCKGLLLCEISGKINDFQRQALHIAQIDQFAGSDVLELTIVSCLPDSMRRDRRQQEIDHLTCNGERLEGDPGHTIVGDLTVIDCIFWHDSMFKILGRIGQSLVYFWHKTHLAPGQEVRIRSRIKKFHGNTTQLNYVTRKR